MCSKYDCLVPDLLEGLQRSGTVRRSSTALRESCHLAASYDLLQPLVSDSAVRPSFHTRLHDRWHGLWQYHIRISQQSFQQLWRHFEKQIAKRVIHTTVPGSNKDSLSWSGQANQQSSPSRIWWVAGADRPARSHSGSHPKLKSLRLSRSPLMQQRSDILKPRIHAYIVTCLLSLPKFSMAKRHAMHEENVPSLSCTTRRECKSSNIRTYVCTTTSIINAE